MITYDPMKQLTERTKIKFGSPDQHVLLFCLFNYTSLFVLFQELPMYRHYITKGEEVPRNVK